uniref:Uncharacterized protein n=1 Tax=Trypanosoma congolense (strain IL3000) TaxID=1068625 RepID=G0UN38_TRYCI|nr:conserved hypothetical protein [Trypanosoma congolense IL3000]
MTSLPSDRGDGCQRDANRSSAVEATMINVAAMPPVVDSNVRMWLERMPTTGSHPLLRAATRRRTYAPWTNGPIAGDALVTPLPLRSEMSVPGSGVGSRKPRLLDQGPNGIPFPSYEMRQPHTEPFVLWDPPLVVVRCPAAVDVEEPRCVDPDEKTMNEFFSITEPPLWGQPVVVVRRPCENVSLRGNGVGHSRPDANSRDDAGSDSGGIGVGSVMIFQRSGARRSRHAGPGYEPPRHTNRLPSRAPLLSF